MKDINEREVYRIRDIPNHPVRHMIYHANGMKEMRNALDNHPTYNSNVPIDMHRNRRLSRRFDRYIEGTKNVDF